MKTHMRNGAAGFSLVELMIAMTVTLIVSGAIYGLLTSGGNAFRREPEVADRQQNIRLAMDLVARDVFNAGAAVPTYGQVFTRTDPAGGSCVGVTGLNGCGLAGSLGAADAANRGLGDGGDPSTNTDVIEMVAGDEDCPHHTVCNAADAGAAGQFIMREASPLCLQQPGLALLTDDRSYTVQSYAWIASQACPNAGAAANNSTYQLGAVLPPWVEAPLAIPVAQTNPLPALPVVFLYRARVIRYRIANNTDPLDPSPSLWRSETGRYDNLGAVQVEPGAGVPGPNWQLVARGIEDLQFEYMAGDGVWRNQPAIVIDANPATLVRQVRITLSARALAPNLEGQTAAAGAGGNAVRGQLVTVVTPRAAFGELQMGGLIR